MATGKQLSTKSCYQEAELYVRKKLLFNYLIPCWWNDGTFFIALREWETQLYDQEQAWYCIRIHHERFLSTALQFFSIHSSSFLVTHFLYLLIPRNLGPNRKKTHGNGVNTRAMNPSKLPAQRIPRASNTIITSVSPHLPQASGQTVEEMSQKRPK